MHKIQGKKYLCFHWQELQGDQLNMTVFFWYLWKSDYSSERPMVHVFTRQVTF